MLNVLNTDKEFQWREFINQFESTWGAWIQQQIYLHLNEALEEPKALC